MTTNKWEWKFLNIIDALESEIEPITFSEAQVSTFRWSFSSKEISSVAWISIILIELNWEIAALSNRSRLKI